MDKTVDIYSFTMRTIDGIEKHLSEYRGLVLMIVNVASRCGYTSQYHDLEALYQRYKDKGFMILGFPANNFLWQEPGTDAEIKQFCSTKYNITFDMFSKISVKGSDIHPLYRYLTKESTMVSSVKWNFQKYLLDRHGNIVSQFYPGTAPLEEEVIREIEKLIDQAA